MKTKVFKCLIVALCAVSIVGCKTRSNGEFEPTYLYIDGVVTNEDGTPLNAIQISIDTANFAIILKPENMWTQEGLGISNQEGKYSLSYMYNGVFRLSYEWPAEITLTATDTTGIYATQTQKFSIKEHSRAEYDPDQYLTTDGIVKADFVMKKK